MIEHRRLDPAEFQRCVAFVSQQVEALALRFGVPDARGMDLEDLLSALPISTRVRADVMLDGINGQTADGSPAMAVAARYVRALAEDVWEADDRSPIVASPDRSGYSAHLQGARSREAGLAK